MMTDTKHLLYIYMTKYIYTYIFLLHTCVAQCLLDSSILYRVVTTDYIPCSILALCLNEVSGQNHPQADRPYERLSASWCTD